MLVNVESKFGVYAAAIAILRAACCTPLTLAMALGRPQPKIYTPPLCKSEQPGPCKSGTLYQAINLPYLGLVLAPSTWEVSMFTNQPFSFVHQAYPDNLAITQSHCPQCHMLVAAGTEDKYLAIAEAVHKCRTITAPHLTQGDLTRLH